MRALGTCRCVDETKESTDARLHCKALSRAWAAKRGEVSASKSLLPDHEASRSHVKFDFTSSSARTMCHPPSYTHTHTHTHTHTRTHTWSLSTCRRLTKSRKLPTLEEFHRSFTDPARACQDHSRNRCCCCKSPWTRCAHTATGLPYEEPVNLSERRSNRLRFVLYVCFSARARLPMRALSHVDLRLSSQHDCGSERSEQLSIRKKITHARLFCRGGTALFHTAADVDE